MPQPRMDQKTPARGDEEERQPVQLTAARKVRI
jgi:hypothetical protein